MKRFLYIPILWLITACTASFNFTGGALNTDLETIGIAQFINEAPIIVPALAQDFTEALQDRFLSQSRLSLASGPADINISGVITGYAVDPVAFTGISSASTTSSNSQPRTAQNRLKISIRVKYENNVEPNESWEQTFSSFSDFDATLDFTAEEQRLIEEVIEQLTQDIFNKSLGKW